MKKNMHACQMQKDPSFFNTKETKMIISIMNWKSMIMYIYFLVPYHVHFLSYRKKNYISIRQFA